MPTTNSFYPPILYLLITSFEVIQSQSSSFIYPLYWPLRPLSEAGYQSSNQISFRRHHLTSCPSNHPTIQLNHFYPKNIKPNNFKMIELKVNWLKANITNHSIEFQVSGLKSITPCPSHLISCFRQLPINSNGILTNRPIIICITTDWPQLQQGHQSEQLSIVIHNKVSCKPFEYLVSKSS